MKKTTLCLSLLLAGSSAFAVNPTELPELSTSRDDAKLYSIVSYRGDRSGVVSILDGVALDEQVSTNESEVTETAMWYFLEGPEEGSYYICNYGLWDSEYPEDDPTLSGSWKVAYNTEEGTPMYILPNGVNEVGLAISKTNPISGSSCLDKFNAGAGVSGGWNPSAGDWEGTTWFFVPVDKDADATANWDAVAKAWSDVHAGPVKAAAVAALEALAASNPWTVADFDAALTELDGLSEYTQESVNTVINAAIEKATATINTEIAGKMFTMQGVRNIAMSADTNFVDVKTFVGVGEVQVDSATVAPGLLTTDKSASTVWTAVKSDAGIKLQNVATKEYVAALPTGFSVKLLTTTVAEEAADLTVGFFGGTYAGVNFYTPMTGADGNIVNMAINVSGRGLNGAYGTMVVSYLAADAGSTFKIELADPAGIQGVEVENANGPVEFYNIQGIRVNPETAGPGLYIRRQGNTATKVLVR